MSQSVASGRTPQEVAHVFPFHLGFDEHLHIVQLGSSLSKLVSQLLALRQPKAELMTKLAAPRCDERASRRG
jgi:hypothetical protein